MIFGWTIATSSRKSRYSAIFSNADGSKYGHAVTVIQNPDGSIGFASDFKQKNASGQANEARVGSFYVQRRG